MGKGISQTYRSRQTAENCSYSMGKPISFYAFSVAVRRSPTTASEPLISWVYRTQASGTEKLSIFQWEPCKVLFIFRCGR